MQSDSTTGLTTRTASVLSYLGWWMTGLLFWAVERRDAVVRFHAAQATVAFGMLALVLAGLVLAAGLMLSFLPAAFGVFVVAAGVVWVGSVVLWGMALWHASQGKRWRIPLASRVADRWLRTSASSPL